MVVGSTSGLNIPQPPPRVTGNQAVNRPGSNNQGTNQGPRAAAMASANAPVASSSAAPATAAVASVASAAAGPVAGGRGAPGVPQATGGLAGLAQVASPAANPASAFPGALAAMGAVAAASTGETQKTGDRNRDKGMVGRTDRGPDNTQVVDQPSALSEGDTARDSSTQDSASAQTSGPAT